MTKPLARLKKILNSHEALADERLQEVCTRNGARVFSKVRLADVFPIERSGISKEEYHFALQAHFDFLVTDSESEPLFAVEYDGNLHATVKQQSRDRLKDSLCDQFGLPILRINSSYLWQHYRGMDLLTWFIEVWFAWQWYQKAKDAGEIPWDDIFSPWAIVNIPGSSRRFPLWLSAPLRSKIQDLCATGKILDRVPNVILARCKTGAFKAIGYVFLDDSRGVLAQSQLRSQKFPIGEFGEGEVDALDELIIFELYQRLEAVLTGEEQPLTRSEIERVTKEIREECQMVRGFGSNLRL